ncbi:2-dehydro-3-deoxygalactonokinase [Chitinimonas koreensis]|uniref:2-dehydro-3-deoxygalactonokinase n=1 Tax=Chitinimonas koreensis TaxID=356302 RepID=UPI00040E07E9|nr:2-dehydro-3-deoxygalactonokinase [Chitinimonas koreensis]QNM95706.1 2-dehydro-3-deoxygalactonokinase [Chitinimonas koreensis]
MIAVDWGTSSFRAYRLDESGAVREQRSAAAGLLACRGGFEAVLAQQLAGWDDAGVVMAGMIGSRGGWLEVPYLACPAGAPEIAAGMREVVAPSLSGRRVWIVPGLAHQPAAAPPEVMRGEETQVLGLLGDLAGTGPHWLCLPGTHGKWVCVEDGRIVSLRTAMTGELYALLRRHSLLAALMPASGGPDDADGDDPAAFERGVAASKAPGGLAHQLFGVRSQGLLGTLAAEQAPSYLSGLLIGHELRGLLPAGTRSVQLIGGADLVRRYALALALLGVAATPHGEALGARGLHLLARLRGIAA